MSTIRLVIECGHCGAHNRMERLTDPTVAQLIHVVCHDCETPLTADTTTLMMPIPPALRNILR